MGDPAAAPAPSPERRWHGLALAATLLLVAVVLGLLPFVVGSMVTEFRGDATVALYDLRDGQPIGAGEEVDPAGAEYLNVAVVDLDEAAGSATLAISGNRPCVECGEKVMTFLALDDDASQRRGLSPFVVVTIPAGDTAFSERVELPVRGSPTRYPFDAYRLRLGVVLPPPESATVGSDGAPSEPGAQVLATLQSQLAQFVMSSPVALDPEQVASSGLPEIPHGVLGLEFRRPAYLPVLAVLLIVLVAVSSGLALVTQAVDSLMLGVGGLILAVWGVRSVLVPSSLEAVTAVDLALSGVILLLLLGLAVRAALHLQRRTGYRLPRRRKA